MGWGRKARGGKSWRQVKGLNGWYVALLVVGVFVETLAYLIMVAYTFIMAMPSGVIKPARFLSGMGVFVPGKKIVLVRSEKSPRTSAKVGSVCREGLAKS